MKFDDDTLMPFVGWILVFSYIIILGWMIWLVF